MSEAGNNRAGVSVDLDDLLNDGDSHVVGELKSTPEVIGTHGDLDVDKLHIQARRWHKVGDAVAVVADMKNSTRLGLNKWAASTASIYEAAIKPTVELLAAFGADYVAIQGDAAFGIFWGQRRVERAIGAGITVKTFSAKSLTSRLEQKWPDMPSTGFKIGVAAGPLLAKRVGIPRTDHQNEVWPGKAVNYATKAAQCADAHQLIVTKTVWERIENNQYLTHSCGCGSDAGPVALWKPVTIDRLREEEPDRDGRALGSCWCDIHGAEFCTAILDGEKKRDEVRKLLDRASRDKSLAAKERRDLDRRLSMASLRRSS